MRDHIEYVILCAIGVFAAAYPVAMAAKSLAPLKALSAALGQ